MSPNNVKFGGFSLDVRDEKLFRDDIPVKLNPKTFQVLKLLIENADSVVSKETFFKTVWQGSIVEDNNLTVAVVQIRKALEETPGNKFVETVPKKVIVLSPTSSGFVKRKLQLKMKFVRSLQEVLH